MPGRQPTADATRSRRVVTAHRGPGTLETGGDHRSTGRLPYLPGLDGLRALAVVAVLLYHAGLAWIPGGFLGVEVFFVISGFLITSLLVAQRRAHGRIDLKAFWLGRARRLLPAVFLMIAVTLTFAVVFLPGEVAGLRGDTIASFGYVTNWYLIFEHESYFEAVGRPSLLRHLWSLAVEEQFYLLWPPVFAVGMSAGALYYRRRRLLFVALAGAAASALLMAALYQPGVDPSRVYYGTDTRATGLLVGVALAFVWPPGQVWRGTDRLAAGRRLGWTRRKLGWTLPLWLDVAGLAALGGLVWSCLRLGEYQPFLYRGGLASVALTTAVLIAAVVHPRAHLGLLGCRPLRWIGVRSYSIYLWHWPVFMVSRPQLDVPIDGLPLLLARLAATVAIADLSYRYVEAPIRAGALGKAWKRLREARGSRRRRLGLRWAGAVVPLAASCMALGLAVAYAEPPEPPSYLSKMAVHAETAAAEVRTSPAVDESGREDRARRATAATTGETSAIGTAIGDSVMLGAVDALPREMPNLTVIDARGSRQAPEAIGLLRQLRTSGKLGDVVVVHIGNNGVLTPEEFDEMMGVLTGVRKVLVVNTTVPDGYTWVPNNEVLADGVKRHPDNAVLVDWYAASVGHPEYFWDGLHLTPPGAQAYAGLIAAAYHEE